MSALEGPLINLSTSAFWDLKLDEESTMLATLATSYERYRWLRLPFVSTFRVKYFRNIIKNYMIFPVFSVMVSIIKFSIVIGSPLAYLSRNQRAISWVSNYTVWVPIWTVCNWIPTWFTRQFTPSHFNGFLRNASHNFLRLWKALQMFSLKRTSQKTFVIPKFVIDAINLIAIGPGVVQFRE